METIIEDDVLNKLLNKTEDNKQIILFDDPVTPFEKVIVSLIQICGHSLEQSEQLTTIAHLKGRASVKVGSYEKLEPICSKLLNVGLTAEIQ